MEDKTITVEQVEAEKRILKHIGAIRYGVLSFDNETLMDLMAVVLYSPKDEGGQEKEVDRFKFYKKRKK